VLFAVILTASVGAGCALFESFKSSETHTAQRQFLPPIPAPKDTVELEIFFAYRTIGDTLSGESLWKSVNQAAGALSSRVKLKEAGIQFGVTPSTPPFGLVALMDPARRTGTARETVKQPVTIFSGGSTYVPVAFLPDQRTIPSADPNRKEPLPVSDVDCAFTVSAQRVQDGWTKVTFVPEIYHGEKKVRHVATDRDWALRDSRDKETYYDRQFSVELNTGEYVVIGMAGKDVKSLGGLFFRGGEDSSQLNLVMIVRLKGMREIQAVSSSGATR
jgi:hypothetical protein